MRKPIYRRLLVFGAMLAVLLLASWCGSAIMLRPAEMRNEPHTETECLALMRERGYSGAEHMSACKVPAPDQGRVCTSSPQCAGYCAPSLIVGRYAIGQCSYWKINFGCFSMVQGGRVIHFCSD